MSNNDLIPAPTEITDRVKRLVADHFPILDGAVIAVLVRDEPIPAEDSESEGQLTVAQGGVNRDDPSLPFEYVMWFALSVYDDLDDNGRDAIIFHELCHCGRDESGDPLLIPHDAGVFNREVELYGVWWEDAQQMLKARTA